MKSDPYLLHMFNPTKNVSPFDVNMAYEADFCGVIPYSDVSLEDIHGLTQDTIFSRGPTGVKRTGIFIGGRDFSLSLDMLKRAKAAMVPPFEVSVFADPSGAITTAAAMVACVEHWVLKQDKAGLEGKNVSIIGLGPVGVCAGVLASKAGANVRLVSHQGPAVGEEVAEEYNMRFGVNMTGAGSRTDEEVAEFMQDTHVVIGAAKAGIRIMRADQLGLAKDLIVAADVNAVPPLGIEGVDVHDMGVAIANTDAVGIGALAIGDVKYKVHYRLFKLMIESENPIYIDHLESFKVAREIVKKRLS